MNSKLYIVSGSELNLNLLQWNVDQAVREEEHEETRWNVRYPRVQALINDTNADIVCLQEMRKLPNTISVKEFLNSFQQYDYFLSYRNPTQMSLGQTILYNPQKFFPLTFVNRWLSDTPDTVSDPFNGFGAMVVGVRFAPVQDGKICLDQPHFWVFNTHFGLDEAQKTASCHYLLNIVDEISKSEPFVVCGDFNFFPDRDGHQQRAILTDFWQDLGKDAKTLSGRLIEGTFVGYDHDTFKSDLNNMTSRVDHVFGSPTVRGYNPILYTKTMLDEEPTELTTRNYPSDHLPILVNITF